MQPHGLQHARLPYPPLSPGVCSSSYPLSWWCYLTTSSPTALFSFCLHSLPASGSFPVSWLFESGGQIIGASALASVISMNIQGWFPSGWTGLISSQSNRLSRVFSSTTVWKHQFFGAQPSSWSSHLKKDEILPFVRPRMDLEDIMLNKSGGEGQILYDFIYVWNIKNQ